MLNGHSALPVIWKMLGGPPLDREFRFMPTRRWRFDFAVPKARVAIEVEGGVWTHGRHVSAKGFIADCEKYNAAAALGWRVFRVPAHLVGEEWLAAPLKAAKEKR